MKDKENYTSRERKKEKKNDNFQKNGKYSSKHIRMVALINEKNNNVNLNKSTK